jgi:CBS domain-containing protein
MLKCSELMTTNPVCCLPGDTIESVAQWMKNEDVGSLPVVENHQTQKLIGIVTDRDITMRVIAEKRDPNNTRVVEVMTPNPIRCDVNDSLDKAADAMSQNQIRRIPIVNQDQQIVGIIAQADLATRLQDSRKSADVVQDVSQPNSVSVRS